MHIGGKMTRDGFVSNLAGMQGATDGEPNGKDFSKELLEVHVNELVSYNKHITWLSCAGHFYGRI